MTFRTACYALMVLCAGLAIVLLAVPDMFAVVFGMSPDPAAAVMTRRALGLFVGLGGLIYCVRHVIEPAHQRSILRVVVVLMAAMAALGLVEFFQSDVGVGIFVAVIPEVIFATLFWRYAWA